MLFDTDGYLPPGGPDPRDIGMRSYVGVPVLANGVAVAVLSAVFTLEADLLSGQEFSNRLIPYWNALVALGV